MFSKSRPDNDFEIARCPVCTASFGERDKTRVFKAHCSECRTTYWWKAWADKPNSVLDSAPKPKRYCDRNGCYCRD